MFGQRIRRALIGVGTTGADAPRAELSVLHVMSNHAAWKGNREQFESFQAGLSGVDVACRVACRVVELDTKRDSDEAAIAARVAEAERLVAEWRPDLICTNDDSAQKVFARECVGGDIPVVFSGVNRDLAEYGFRNADNVTGVIEPEHGLRWVSEHSRLPDLSD